MSDPCREAFEKFGGTTTHEDMWTDYTKVAWQFWQVAWNAPRWIPVSERLPEAGVEVLAFVPDANPKAVVSWWRHDGFGWGRMAYGQPTHWQPLPEAPHE